MEIDGNDPNGVEKLVNLLKTGIQLVNGLRSLWPKVDKNKNFDQALNDALSKINKHYGKKLFGDNIHQVFKNPEVREPLKQVLLGYGDPDKDLLAPHIDFDTLPDDFFEKLLSYLIEELLQYEDTRKGLVDWLNSQDLTFIKKEVSETKEGVNEIRDDVKELLLLIRPEKGLISDSIESNQYESISGYLQRSLLKFEEFDSVNLESSFNRTFLLDTKALQLDELVDTSSKIVILGVGGFGKSTELRQVAYSLSKRSNCYPLLIDLKNYWNETIENLLLDEFKDWEKVPEENLFVVFDGLDEVHQSKTDEFIRKLNRFSKYHDRIKIIVSCRNNQYPLDDDQKGALENFEVYSLAPLKHDQIQAFLKEQLSEKAEEFFNHIWNNNLYDLIQSPFYLIKITELYSQEGFLPEKKADLFNYLITEKIKSDYNKFKLVGIDLLNYDSRIKGLIASIAFVSQCLGMSYLNESEELQLVVSDIEMLKRIQRAFLFNRGSEGTWEFEHNNFREYLAAKFLSDKSLDFIKNVVAFAPNFSKIEPKWVNTLTFLISILPKESVLKGQVLNWIVDIEPDLLFRMEKEKLDLEVRTMLARDIVVKYESRNLWLRSEKFTTGEISKFVSDSTEIFDWMIGRLSTAEDSVTLTHTLEILEGLSIDLRKKDEVVQSLMSALKRDGFDEHCYYKIAKQLITLDFNDPSIIEVLHTKSDFKESQYIRASLYLYIHSFGYSDQHIDILIEGISLVKKVRAYINSSRTKRAPVIEAESRNLIDSVNGIKDVESIKKLLKWALGIDRISPPLHIEKIIEIGIEKSIELFSSDPDILELMVELFLKIDRIYAPEIEAKILEFFSETGSRFKAFEILFDRCKNDKDDHYYSMYKLADVEAAGVVFKSYTEGNLSDEFVRGFRNLLWRTNDQAHNWFHSKINEFSNDKFLYPPPEVSWEERVKHKHKQDIHFLFNKPELLLLVKEVYQEYGLTELEIKDTYRSYRRKNPSLEIEENLALDIIRDLAEDQSSVSEEGVIKFINDEKIWERYKVGTLLQKDIRGDLSLEGREINFLKSWFENRLPECDFKKGIYKLNGGWYYNTLERRIAYLAQEFDFSIPCDLTLDFVYMDDSSYILKKHSKLEEEKNLEEAPKLTDWVASQCGFDKTRDKVLECLDGTLFNQVRVNLLSFCAKNDIKEAIPYFISTIKDSSFQDYHRYGLLEGYFKLTDDYEPILSFLGDFDSDTQLHAIDLLGKNNYSGFEELCLKFIEEEADEREKLKIINKLGKYKHLSGYQEIGKWVVRNNDLPDDFYHNVDPPVELLDQVLEPYIDIYEAAVENDFGDWDFRNRRGYLEVILKAGALSESNYNRVRSKFEEWIERFQNHSFLHLKLEELDTLYYQNITPVMTIDEAVRLIES
ncbi:MAG: hypothetical protein ABJG47_13080 [Ekhidna sp.]